MKPIFFTELADTDIDEIWISIARDNEAAADRLIDELHEVMRRVTEFPGMGRSADQLRLGARAFVHGNYLIVYQPMEYGIAVLRIAHGARNLQLIEFPPGPQEVQETPLIFGRDVLVDAADRMGDPRLRISPKENPAQR